ncbi:unnamed protein product [marine sediment metagenome]|uniref:Uncharacterized protein n=1 Tax=marine sediment metagenome TaxID=412755 RepID=X1KRH0_9ZZZZ
MSNTRKTLHAIDTRFTWSGSKAKEFIKLAKEEYGSPMPYGAIRQLIRLACAKFVEANRKEENNNGKTSI